MVEKQEQEKLDEVQAGDIVDEEFVQGFALSGDYVKELEDKKFVIVGQRTQMVPKFKNPAEITKKLILSVKMIANATIIDYYPNKTSQRVIIVKRGYRLADWIGFEGEFFIENEKVGKEKKKVIYIKDKK